MNDSRRLGMPIVVMIVSTLIFYLINTYIRSEIAVTMLIIIFDVSLFIFGSALNAKKRSHRVYRKVIALVCSIILLLIQLGAVSLPFVDTLKAFFATNPYLLSMMLIYFGFLYVD